MNAVGAHGEVLDTVVHVAQEGRTPLYIAVQSGASAVVQRLVELKADITAQAKVNGRISNDRFVSLSSQTGGPTALDFALQHAPVSVALWLS